MIPINGVAMIPTEAHFEILGREYGERRAAAQKKRASINTA
jgi:hypothetical protein